MALKMASGSTAGPTGSRNRLRVGLVLMMALLLLLGGRLFQVQALDPSGMAQAAVNERVRSHPITPLRGDIIDAHGNILATSVQRYDIVVDQRKVPDTFHRWIDNRNVEITKDEAVQELAEILGHDRESVRVALTGDKPFHYVAKSVTPEIRDAAMENYIPGVMSEAASQRTYPAGAVGGALVGFLGTDTALGGIEMTQDDALTGEAGQLTYQIGADGIRIPTAPRTEVPAVDGQTVQLTINQDIQWFAQQQIASQVERLNAQWGTIVVLEVETGRLIAMAQSVSPDPNNPGATPADRRQSLAVTEATEPGSTQKMITMAAVIEEGIAGPLSEYLVPKTYTVNGQTFSDAFDHTTEKRTMAGIFGDSMNTGTVMIGQQLTREQRYEWMRKFGIGEKPGVPLPGQTAGILAPANAWDGRQEFTVLFGQGVAQSALHTAVAYQTIANDGVRLDPRLIDAYIDPDGTRHEAAVEPGIRVVSDETAQQVQDMLETTVSDAGAQSAQMDSYRVGGKTGTAEAPSPEGGYDGYTASFVGMAPMEDPKYVVGVTLQRPQGDIYGITAGPTFSAVMGQTLQRFNVPPSTGESPHLPLFYK